MAIGFSSAVVEGPSGLFVRIEERAYSCLQEPASNATQTGHEVRSSEKEDAEAENPEKEVDWQEEMMQHPGWLLVTAGLVLASIGVVWLIAPSIPWLGRLPGDIAVERENIRLYVPIVTCILVSVVLTGILSLVRFFSR